jgi:glutamate--cysteine ligase
MTQYMMILIIAGMTPAEKLLQMYHEKWAQNVDPVFEELRY